jgi:hypothetical protein
MVIRYIPINHLCFNIKLFSMLLEMSLVPCLTNANPSLSLLGGGGGGGGSGPDLLVSTITFPDGQLYPTTGINFNTVLGLNGQTTTNATDFIFIAPTTLSIFDATPTNTIQINSPDGSGAVLTINALDTRNSAIIAQDTGNALQPLSLVASAVNISSLNVSTINNVPTPFQSTITGGNLDGPFPFTCPAGTTTALQKGYTLLAGHTYTATFNCTYALNTSDQTMGIIVSFDDPTNVHSIGSVYSPPASVNNATSSDGASAAFSLSWKQYITSTEGGVYITPSGTGYDCLIRQNVAGSDPRLVITDYGILSL